MTHSDHPAFMRALHDDLRRLTPPTLAPGFDARVLATLRERRAKDAVASVMARQFWRLAAPAAAAAIILAALAGRGDTATPSTEVSLASWYSLSADPTTQP